jgi:hypothetical protein
MTNLIYRAQPNRSTDNPFQLAGEIAGGPVVGIGNRIWNGTRLAMDGEVARGVEQMLPAAFGNLAKASRYYREGATTLRGDPIVEDIGLGSIAGQALGFAPTGYTRMLERNAMDKRIDRVISRDRTRLLRKYYLALRENDVVEMSRIERDMDVFSDRHPEVRIDGKTIRSSVRQHKITDEMARELSGITVSRRRYARVLEQRMADEM